MNKIHLLAEHEALKIAAGEVVERPAHIIKELLENALDASATKIDIHLEDAGKKLISVIDNGCGMTSDDAQLCFIKHATSKITSLEDLEELSSFGFRGEALASIAAVSKVTLRTRRHDDQLGTMIRYEQGKIIHQEATACSAGTEFEIHDLFYNMPARKKFLRHNETEINQVQNLIYATCLSNLGVHVRFYNEHKLVLNAPPVQQVQDRVSQLWGYNTAQNLTSLVHELDSKNQWLALSGAVSLHTLWRYSRDRIFLFVNNRWVKDQDLSKALVKGYSNALPPGKFPIGVIFITVQPGFVDINVHPKKEEVRFLKPNTVESGLQKSVQKSLEMLITKTLIPAPVEHRVGREPNIEPEENIITNFKTETLTTNTPKPTFEIPLFDFPVNSNQKSNYTNTEINNFEKKIAQETIVNQATITQEPTKKQEVPYKIIGQLFNTYIMLEKTDEFVMIDQHAAHERILYEKWQSNFEGLANISLIFPEIIAVPGHHVPLLIKEQEIFQRLGITLEAFGSQEIIITTTPPNVAHAALKDLINEAGVFIEEHQRLDALDLRKKLYEHMHSHMACKAAVRAGDVLNSVMIQQLITDLLQSENRFQCIHGRPTMWIITKHEFEKKFRRC